MQYRAKNAPVTLNLVHLRAWESCCGAPSFELRLASWGAWVRPLAAVLAGIIADRFNARRSIAAMFLILAVSYAAWCLASPPDPGLAFVYVNFFTTYFAVYTLRGVYFALLEENRTPNFLTGAPVGDDLFARVYARRLFRADFRPYSGCKPGSGRLPKLLCISGQYRRFRSAGSCLAGPVAAAR